jgi:hypothetical protein
MTNAPMTSASTRNARMTIARTTTARTIWLLIYELEASLLPV